jgi:hypothetical protein
MKTKNHLIKPGNLAISVIFSFMLFCTCFYMKMNPPPDVDKSAHGHSGTSTCWIATGSNMLAGAGYGTGSTVQDRADGIYNQIVANFGTGSGWTDTALNWWLSSTHNTWTGNRYTIVTVHGNKIKIPWAEPNGAQYIGNELRRCQFVGLSISWPREGFETGEGGHAITGWGDNIDTEKPITQNPAQIRVTDSDNDNNGDFQVYNYDDYTNPNPGGPNHGNGWYFDYSSNHPFIKHIVTLCPTTNSSGNVTTQKVLGSYKIHQSDSIAATDLHYNVYTDVEILTYRTWLDWFTSTSPSITEIGTPRKELEVNWNLSKNPVPYCKWVTINTEFILPRYNAIFYKKVHFTYPNQVQIRPIPDLKWMIRTPIKEGAVKLPNVTGGYIIGSFDVLDPQFPEQRQVVGQYRFIHEYSFDQDPEIHDFSLTGTQGFLIANLRFGHSYGYFSKDELWKFKEWTTLPTLEKFRLGDEPIKFGVDWRGKLPYPKGEDFTGKPGYLEKPKKK